MRRIIVDKALPLKNKSRTYILLVAVLSIWGIIGYKMILTLHPPATQVQPQQSITDFRPKSAIQNDTFSIELVARDPFLGKTKDKNVGFVKKERIRVVVEWPQVVYDGMVKKQNANVQVFVITINGNQHLFKKGQRIDDITLVRGNIEEIVVGYNKLQKTIALQK